MHIVEIFRELWFVALVAAVSSARERERERIRADGSAETLLIRQVTREFAAEPNLLEPSRLIRG